MIRLKIETFDYSTSERGYPEENNKRDVFNAVVNADNCEALLNMARIMIDIPSKPKGEL